MAGHACQGKAPQAGILTASCDKQAYLDIGIIALQAHTRGPWTAKPALIKVMAYK